MSTIATPFNAPAASRAAPLLASLAAVLLPLLRLSAGIDSIDADTLSERIVLE